MLGLTRVQNCGECERADNPRLTGRSRDEPENRSCVCSQPWPNPPGPITGLYAPGDSELRGRSSPQKLSHGPASNGARRILCSAIKIVAPKDLAAELVETAPGRD